MGAFRSSCTCAKGSYISGKCQANLIFFKVRELSGNSVMCGGKMKICKKKKKKNVREMSENFTVQLDEAMMFVLMYFLAEISSSDIVREI